MTQSLIERARKIVKTWLSQVPALDKFAIVDDKLMFEDLNNGHTTGTPHQYSVRWAMWDGNGRTDQLPDAIDTEIPDVGSSDARYLTATFACAGSGVCEKPVTVYLRRCDSGLEVVGIDR